MTNQITYYPQNKEYFENLLSFYEILFKLCENLKIKPIVYGSLAYAFYTQDKEISINDIDLLVEEKNFDKIINELGKYSDLTFEITTYNSLKVFLNGVKITFDSIKHYYYDESLLPDFIEVEINNHKFTIVSLDSLKIIYSKWVENIPIKREQYKKKLEKLSNI